ncbi:MAG: hypothetical protein R3A13_11255 [Bdellovibrionota bacterium]
MSVIQNPLEFEREIVALELQLSEMQDEIASGDESHREEYAKLEDKVAKLRKRVYGKLTSHQQFNYLDKVDLLHLIISNI